MSRIAREAVHQPADPRLDKQLERMGLLEQASGRPPAVAPEIDRLRAELRRLKAIVWVLAGVAGILAVLVVVLLVR
jgi:hypothetical protein